MRQEDINHQVYKSQKTEKKLQPTPPKQMKKLNKVPSNEMNERVQEQIDKDLMDIKMQLRQALANQEEKERDVRNEDQQLGEVKQFNQDNLD